MKPKFFVLTALSLQVFFASAQNKFTDLVVKIDNDLQMLSEKYPRERIALFTDKQEYIVGENIFISTFLLLEGKASPLSKTVYVEVGDYSGKIIEKKMLSVEKGSSNTIISISPEWTSGAYVINAYSLWMKNTPQLIAQKQVFVVGKDFVEKPFTLQSSNGVVTKVNFQPEGKSWITHVAQNFVLSLADKNDIPVTINFSVLENGKEIATGQTDKNGLAKLSLTVKTGIIYQLKAGNQQLPLTLPANEGIGLSFNTENKTRLFVSLQKSASVKSNQFLLVAINEEKVCYQSVFDFAEGTIAAAIPKIKLPQGLLQFLLFDEALSVVAQREYFNYFTASKTNDKNNIIKVDSLTAGILSVTIPRQQTFFSKGQNIISLLPGIQLNSHIQLEDLSPASLQTIDALLFLQPADRIGKPWHINEPALKFPVESGITIKGNIKPFAGSKSPTGYKAEIIIKGEDSTTAFTTVQTNPDGDFIIGDVSFQREARVFFQGNNLKKGNELLNMTLYPSYFDTLSHLTVMPSFRYEKQYANAVANDDIKKYFADLASDPTYKSLETIVIKTKAKTPFDSLKQVYLTPVFTDGNAIILQPEGHFINFWHFLRGRIPGLKVDGNIDDPAVSITRYGGTITAQNNSGEDLSESFGEAAGVLFFLNEIQVSKDVVSTINPDDVALVSVMKDPVAALGAYNGAIAIFTKKGRSAGGTTAKSMSLEKRSGYSNFMKVFGMTDDEYKPGKTVLFAPVKKAIELTLPAAHNYQTTIIGWSLNNELVIKQQ